MQLAAQQRQRRPEGVQPERVSGQRGIAQPRGRVPPEARVRWPLRPRAFREAPWLSVHTYRA